MLGTNTYNNRYISQNNILSTQRNTNKANSNPLVLDKSNTTLLYGQLVDKKSPRSVLNIGYQSRYMVLVYNNITLQYIIYYYKNKHYYTTNQPAQGQIYIENIISTRKDSHNGHWCILLNNRLYELKSQNLIDASNWLDHINYAIQQSDSKLYNKPLPNDHHSNTAVVNQEVDIVAPDTGKIVVPDDIPVQHAIVSPNNAAATPNNIHTANDVPVTVVEPIVTPAPLSTPINQSIESNHNNKSNELDYSSKQLIIEQKEQLVDDIIPAQSSPPIITQPYHGMQSNDTHTPTELYSMKNNDMESSNECKQHDTHEQYDTIAEMPSPPSGITIIDITSPMIKQSTTLYTVAPLHSNPTNTDTITPINNRHVDTRIDERIQHSITNTSVLPRQYTANSMTPTSTVSNNNSIPSNVVVLPSNTKTATDKRRSYGKSTINNIPLYVATTTEVSQPRIMNKQSMVNESPTVLNQHIPIDVPSPPTGSTIVWNIDTITPTNRITSSSIPIQQSSQPPLFLSQLTPVSTQIQYTRSNDHIDSTDDMVRQDHNDIHTLEQMEVQRSRQLKDNVLSALYEQINSLKQQVNIEKKLDHDTANPLLNLPTPRVLPSSTTPTVPTNRSMTYNFDTSNQLITMPSSTVVLDEIRSLSKPIEPQHRHASSQSVNGPVDSAKSMDEPVIASTTSSSELLFNNKSTNESIKIFTTNVPHLYEGVGSSSTIPIVTELVNTASSMDNVSTNIANPLPVRVEPRTVSFNTKKRFSLKSDLNTPMTPSNNNQSDMVANDKATVLPVGTSTAPSTTSTTSTSNSRITYQPVTNIESPHHTRHNSQPYNGNGLIYRRVGGDNGSTANTVQQPHYIAPHQHQPLHPVDIDIDNPLTHFLMIFTIICIVIMMTYKLLFT